MGFIRAACSRRPPRRLSGMVRISFDDLLGKRHIPAELTEEDHESDQRDLTHWHSSAGG